MLLLGFAYISHMQALSSMAELCFSIGIKQNKSVGRDSIRQSLHF